MKLSDQSSDGMDGGLIAILVLLPIVGIILGAIAYKTKCFKKPLCPKKTKLEEWEEGDIEDGS